MYRSRGLWTHTQSAGQTAATWTVSAYSGPGRHGFGHIHKNGSVGVVTVAWRTRSLHIPDRSLGLFKPPKVQVKQVTNCTLDCVVFSGPGRHGFGHIQEWVSRCGHTVHCAPVHDLVRSRPGQLAHGQVYYGLFSGPAPIPSNVDYCQCCLLQVTIACHRDFI